MLVSEVAQELGVKRAHVHALIKQGRLRGQKRGPHVVLVEQASVEEYKRTRGPPGRPPKAAR